MGKGDKRSKRGKIIMGSFGVNRPKRKKNSFQTSLENKETVIESPVVEAIKEPKEKIVVEKKTTKTEIAKAPKEAKVTKEKAVKEKKTPKA